MRSLLLLLLLASAVWGQGPRPQLALSAMPFDYRFSEDGRRFAASAENSIHAWDVESLRPLGKWSAPTDLVCLSADGRFLALQPKLSTLAVVDLDAGQKLWELPLEGAYRGALSFSPDGTRLTYVRPLHTPPIGKVPLQRDRSARLIEVPTGKILRRFDGWGEPYSEILWAPDSSGFVRARNQFLQFYSRDGVKLAGRAFDLGPYETLGRVELDAKGVRCNLGVFSLPDLQPVILTDSPVEESQSDLFKNPKFPLGFRGDKNVKIYDLRDGTLLGQLAGINRSAFSPDGKWMAVPVKGGFLILDVGATLENRRLIPR